jgi:hypothetical protein
MVLASCDGNDLNHRDLFWITYPRKWWLLSAAFVVLLADFLELTAHASGSLQITITSHASCFTPHAKSAWL